MKIKCRIWKERKSFGFQKLNDCEEAFVMPKKTNTKSELVEFGSLSVTVPIEKGYRKLERKRNGRKYTAVSNTEALNIGP